MGADETRQYIGHRLSIAGWSGDPTFTPQAYEAIYDYTGGIPRRINSLCDRLLLVGFLEETHEINGELVHNVIQELNEESFATRRGVSVTKTLAPAGQEAENALPLADAPSSVHSHSGAQGLAEIAARLAAVEEAIAMAHELRAVRPKANPEFPVESSSSISDDSGEQRPADIGPRLAALEQDMAAGQDSPEPFMDSFEQSGSGERPPSQAAPSASSRSRVAVIRRLSYLCSSWRWWPG